MADSSVIRTAQAIGITTPFFMSGIYFCSSYLTISNVLNLPTSSSTTVFRAINKDGATLFVPLAFIPTVANAYLAYSGRTGPSLEQQQTLLYASAAASVFGTLIFTVAFMLKGINRICAIAESAFEQEKVSSDVVKGLLEAWISHNYFRAGFSFLGGLFGFAAMFNLAET